MNRRRAIFFLIVAGFCFLGSLPLHWMQTKLARRAMKHRMEAMLEESDLQILEFELVEGIVDDPQFSLRPDGKEFAYQGHHYDIFKVHKEDGKVTFWVLQDEMEDHLLAQMQSGEPSEGPMQSAAKTFLKFFGKSFPNPMMASFQLPSQYLCFAPVAYATLSNHFQEILSPPPQA